MKILPFIFLLVVVAVSVILPVLTNTVLATSHPAGGKTIKLKNYLGGESTIAGVLDNIIDGIRDFIAPPIVAIMVIYGAFQMLFAAGDPENFKTGRKTILYAVVGYAIILIASGISKIIEDLLT